jgi:uncharacterized glyoxalase superfamily protein PhnB
MSPEPTPVPEHLGTVTPRLMVADADAALEFYAGAFGAQVIGDVHRLPDSGTIIHVELRIGSSVVMVAQADGEPTRSLLCTYWPDVDAAWQRALEAGAEVVYPLADQVYGERGGRVQDPFGQQWMMAARTEVLTAEEIAARMRS